MNEEQRRQWTLRDIDAALVADGWPPTSPWWWNVLEEFEESIKRHFVIRGGRRGGKSSTICGRVAVRELLSDRHVVPPGDVGYFAILSADKDQAQERLDTCSKALTSLGIPEGKGQGTHRKTANEITLNDRNVGIKAFAATLKAVVSFTCIGFICDEMARWKDNESGTNPAKQILTSLRATMLTMPSAKGWYVSAPWSTLDEHHEMVTKGTNDSQSVFIGTSTEMNPTLTDKMIEDLEPDEPSRMREYYVVPMASDETKFFAASHVDDAAKVVFAPYMTPDRTASGGDFAFRRNSSTIVVLEKIAQRFRVKRDEERIPGIKALVPSETITDLVGIAEKEGADSIACDLHYIESVREHVDDLSLELLEFPSDSDHIAKAYIRTRVLISQGRCDLSKASPKLLKQLKETTSQPTQTGLTIRNKTIDGAHGDLVSAFVCAVWAMDQEVLAKNPTTGPRRFPRGASSPQPGSDLTDYPPENTDN